MSVAVQCLCSHALRIAVSDAAPCGHLPVPSLISKIAIFKKVTMLLRLFALSSYEVFLVVQSPSGEMVTLNQKWYHQPAIAVIKSGLSKVRQSEQR